jgi:hypothetical protein
MMVRGSGGLGLVLAIALALTACGGKNTSAPAGSAALGEPTPQATATVARRPPASAPPRTGPLADRLSRALLSVQDLPGGWRLSRDARGDPDDTTLCGTGLGTLEQQRAKLAEVDVGFERGTTAFIVQAVAAYPPGMAQRVLDDLAATVQPCHELVTRDDEGTLAEWQLTPIPFPQLGDQTVAFREYQAVNQVEALVVYIRRGDLVTVLLDIAIRAPVDRAHTEALARQIERKLAAVGPTP